MESGAARVMAIPASRRPCVLPSGDRRGAHMHERTENSPHAAINKREPFWCIVVGNRIEWALLQKSLLDDPKSVWQHTTHFKTVYVESVDLKTNSPFTMLDWRRWKWIWFCSISVCVWPRERVCVFDRNLLLEYTLENIDKENIGKWWRWRRNANSLKQSQMLGVGVWTELRAPSNVKVKWEGKKLSLPPGHTCYGSLRWTRI